MDKHRRKIPTRIWTQISRDIINKFRITISSPMEVDGEFYDESLEITNQTIFGSREFDIVLDNYSPL